jgi:acetyltransferase-like isoleucine patch superfamily enzyme
MRKDRLFLKLIPWLDEKIVWNRYKFMRWYFMYLYRSKCAEIGRNFNLAEFVRRPVIQGNGKIRIGNDVTIVGPIDLIAISTTYPECEIVIGDGTILGRECSIRARKKVQIGKKCLIAPYVRIYDHNGHPIDPVRRLNGEPVSSDEIKEIVIGNNVWIGEFAHIQQGVKIGDGSIVAAHSVVTRDVEPNSLVFGVPARKILWLTGVVTKPSTEDSL